MADKHDETARGRELWRIYQDAYLAHSERGDPYVSDCQKAGLLAVARKAEADGLREAAGMVERERLSHPHRESFDRWDALRDVEKRIRSLAAEKETNG